MKGEAGATGRLHRSLIGGAGDQAAAAGAAFPRQWALHHGKASH